MTLLDPYERVANRFIETDKELDKLPIRREAAKRRREEERRRKQAVPTATPQPVPPLPPITPAGPGVPPAAPGPFMGYSWPGTDTSRTSPWAAMGSPAD